MANSIRRHLSPAIVISALALFAALGGGYATAFSGSGTLQKGAKLGLPFTVPPSEFTTIRTLAGIGSIQARCEGIAPPQEVNLKLRFHNSSGKTLLAFIDGGQGDPLFEEVGDGEDSDVDANFVDGDTVRYHIVRADGAKTKQADVNVSVYGPETGTANPCADDLVSVLATNTEE